MNRIKYGFILLIIFYNLSVIEYGGISLCRRTTELISGSIKFCVGVGGLRSKLAYNEPISEYYVLIVTIYV